MPTYGMEELPEHSCGWCSAPKTNPLGMCGSCGRFPRHGQAPYEPRESVYRAAKRVRDEYGMDLNDSALERLIDAALTEYRR